MNLSKKINTYWKTLEAKYPAPVYVGKIKTIQFEQLKYAVDNKKEKFLKNLIKNIYVNREAYIVKGCASSTLKNLTLDLANDYKKKRKSSFHKMLDGTPNFHRMIDKKITKKYSLYAIKHSFFLYNWNIKSKLEKKFKDAVYKHWRYIKFLAGNTKKAFENNIPSDGQIDRLQIVRYPAGGGELRDHVDPRKNQRVVSGLIMSKMGEDFKKGGFYFKSSKNKKVNIEKKLNIGDGVIFYGSVIHGVDKVDPNEKLIWNSNKGRWFIGMFVNDSNHVKNRITAKDLTLSVNSR